MEIGWICETPYQIINCLAYVLNHSDEEIKFDLYILHQFANSEKIEKNLRETGLFRNIISLRQPSVKKGISRKFWTGLRIIAPRRWLYETQEIRASGCDISRQYDILFVAVWTIWSITLYYSADIKRVNFFEDGTGSYYKDMFTIQSGIKMIYRLFGRNLDKLKPHALYLNNPDLCKVKTEYPICPLQGLTAVSPVEQEKIYQAFGYKQDGYYAGYRIIYLTQPNDNQIPNMEKTDDKILKMLAQYGKDVLLRPHPRQKSIPKEEVSIDSHQDMWELVCSDQLTNNHVLVSIFSTAQITPKLIYNKEPYLIFLYNLYPELLPQMRGEILELIERIQNEYSRPEKVFLPNTLEELRKCIDQIVEDRCQNEQ